MAGLLPTRRKMRLPDHDYAAVGGHFVTLRIHDRHNVFGRVENGVMLLNGAGEMARDVLRALNETGSLKVVIWIDAVMAFGYAIPRTLISQTSMLRCAAMFILLDFTQ